MKYMGSKARIAKDILPLILDGRAAGQVYVEPFVGGANIIDKVTGPRVGGELNKYIAAMWIALESGWVPPIYITKEQYAHIRDNKDHYPPSIVGYVGICCSYSGKWFGGYAGVVQTKGGTRDYMLEAHRNVMKQVANLRGVVFKQASYDMLEIPDSSIIYCDPPYANTTNYSSLFDSERFWGWCRAKSKEGHRVFVSEYNAPGDFLCIWEKPVSSCLSANGVSGGPKVSTEKLFIPKT